MTIIDNCYVVTPETREEIDLVNKTLLEYREQKRKEKAYQDALEGFEYAIQALIDAVGLADAKRILRHYNRELRES